MINVKKILYVFAIFIILSASAFALQVEFLTGDFQVGAGESANIDVLITHDNGTPLNNTLVNFTTDLGIVSPSSAHSNSSGVAEVNINSTIAGISHINASSGAAYDLTNITFLPLAPVSLLADADIPANVAGQITNITFNPVDIYGNTNSSEQVYLDLVLTDRSGNMAQYNDLPVHTDNITLLEIKRDDENDINWTTSVLPFSSGSGSSFFALKSTIAANITITSAAGSVTNLTELVFLPAEPAGIGAVFNDEYTVNTSSGMYIRIYDAYNNRVPYVDMTFIVTSPEDTVRNSPVIYNSASLNSYSGTTDLNGQLYNVFRTDKRAGDNVITVSVVNSSLKGNITIKGIADEIDNLYLSYSPSSAISNNKDFYTLSARPVDQFLNPILPLTTPIKEIVRFTTESGNLVLVPLNSQGQANTKVGPTPYVESLLVSATYRDASGYTNFTNSTTLYFAAGPLYAMDLYSVPNAVLSQDLNGNHEATVSLVTLDEWGHTLPNVEVTLNNTNTTVGTLSVNAINVTGPVNVTTDANGRISALFTGNVSGNTTITATSGAINVSADLSVKSEPFLSVNLSVSPKNVTSGGIVDIRTIISIEGELPIIRPAASAMLVLDRSGSMDPDYYAGSPLDVVLVLDRSGSMKFLGNSPEQPMTDAKLAAEEFVDNLASNAQVGVVSFSSSSRIDKDMILLNSYTNKTTVKGAIDVLVADGSTAMGDAMADANSMLISGRNDSRKVMVVLTDGVTNAGSDRQGHTAIVKANANDITIYTIGLGATHYLDEPLLQHIAFETGGSYYNAPTSAELRDVYNSIAQEISDYDIRSVEYGVEGFTPYSYSLSGSVEVQEHRLKFEGFDLDTVFNAGSNYGGSSAGECLLQVNGVNFSLIPSFNTGINMEWEDYEYDISNYLEPGNNTITFYDYHHYITNSTWTNKVREVEILWNGTRMSYYPAEVDIDGSGYNCSFNVVKIKGESFEDTIYINETINDLKVQLDWENSSSDLNLKLTSPSGRVYGLNDDTTGYYPKGNTSEYIWIHPLPYLYPDDDTVEKGNWTINVTGTGSGMERFTISTYIDRLSAARTSSHAFMSSFDETRGDKAGLALYSIGELSLSDNQASYLLDNRSWSGYFTVQTNGLYSFDISWADSSEMTVSLYEGTDVLNSTTADAGTSQVSSPLYLGKTYLLEISKGLYSGTDTHFTVDVSSSPLDTIMTAYYDGSDESGKGTPRFRTWGGSQWSMESYSNFIDGIPYFVRLESSPVRNEIIMVTGDDQKDVNAQIWDGNSWDSVSELSTELSQSTRRGFDVKYEQLSGDAVVVYMDVNQDTGLPQYQVWDGSSWGREKAVKSKDKGAGTIRWLRLEANPHSDEMILVTLDSSYDIRAQVWDGSSWDNTVVITNTARSRDYQCFDVVYEQSTGRAIVVWAQEDSTIRYRTWDGSWGSEQTVHSNTTGTNWVKAAADPNSDNIVVAVLGRYNDSITLDNRVDAFTWNGSSWSDSEPIGVTNSNSRRAIDVAFEQSSGRAMLVWADSSRIPKYRIWDGSWGPESSASDIGGTNYWVQLTPDPMSDEIFLMASNSGRALNVQRWDGSSWGGANLVEHSSSRDYECFDITFLMPEKIIRSTPVKWNAWTASVTSSLQNDSVSHLSNSIDTITADGLTAIDEGLFVANNQLSSVDGDSTIVLMTDGIDNAGSRSMLAEAYRAKANNTTIYTVGFGNTESEVDPILAEIAGITGGQYYFAPNSSALEDIFKGIAMQITNFSAGGPELNLHVPYNYVSPLSVAKVTYVPGSSNATTGNLTVFNIPGSPGIGNAEPVISTSGTKSALKWKLPTLGPGDKWGIWHQMKVEGAGYVPLIMPTSTVTYTDLSGENITVVVSGAGAVSVGGSAGLLSSLLGSFEMDVGNPIMYIGDQRNIELTLKDTSGDPGFAYVHLYSSIGDFSNSGYTGNPINVTVVGSDTVKFTSAVAGKAHIRAYAENVNNATDVLEAHDVLYVRPKGMISIS